MKWKKPQQLLVGMFLFAVILSAAFSIIKIGKNEITTSVLGSFSDVDSSYTYYTAIQFLKDNGVIVGYTDGTFKPDDSLTRAELMKIIILGSGLTVPAATSSTFSDIRLGEWYTDYIVFGADHDYIQGYGDGTFKPNQDVNKVEAIKILGELVNWDTDALDTNTIQNQYSDIDFNQWYGKYMAYAIDKNLLDDSGSTFNPASSITRGQISEYIYRDYIVRESNLSAFPNTQASSGLCGTSDVALETLKNDVIANLSEKDELTAFQYNQALASGDSFQYFTDDSDESTYKSIDASKWFYWLDLEPGAHFSHSTKMVTVDGDTCDYSIYDSNWWPIVNDQEIWSTDTERQTTDDLVYEGSKADFAHANAADVVNAADVIIPDCSNDDSSNKWAIVSFFGKDADFKKDAAKMTQFLCDEGYLIVGIDGNTDPTPLQTILDDINVIAAVSKQPGKSLNHFTFYVSSHGFGNTGDIVLSVQDAVNANGNNIKRARIISLDSLASIIEGAGFEEMISEGFTMIHDTCFSGNVTAKYQTEAANSGVPVVGWIGTSSAIDEQSYGLGDGSYFTSALVDCSTNIAPWDTFAACVSGEVKLSLHRGNVQTPAIEKLTPETDDAMPLF